MMKLFSKGPSREGSVSLRLGAKVRACVLWVTLLLGIAIASSAAAQYTVAPGGSVAVSPCINGCTAPPPDPDGPYSYSGAGGRGYYNAAADIYTAPTDWYGTVEIQFMWRSCATCGNPYLTYAGSVFITVAQPKPSITGGSITVPYGGSKAHFFAPTNGGVVSIKSGPSHGTVQLDFTAAIYRPNPGYVGPDSFVAVATNAAGESQPATVNVTVQAPPIPTLTGGNANIPYGSTATHDFAPTNGGVLSLVNPPANGAVTFSGGVATYTPNIDFIGSDTFSVTATNPGGTSAASVFGIYVTPPPIPTLTGGSLGLAFNTPGTHDFAPSSGGVLALASAAAHGTVTISGGRATYTPNSDFIGDDSFGVTASNLGGTSSLTTIAVTVAPPPIPTLSGGSLALAFNTAGTHDFAPTSGGLLALAAAPAHGTVTISGGRATYTPNADYIGPDSFGVTGTNLGGTSPVTTIAVSVAPPPIPALTGGSLSLAFNTAGSHDFAPTERGVLALAAAPANGTVSISGGRVTYTPNQDFIGTDSLSVTATNLGGTSAPMSMSVTVSAPDAPGAGSASLTTLFETPESIELPVTGIFSTVEIVEAPEHGVVTIAGVTASYTPNVGYFGADSFSYRAVGFGGPSGPATVAVSVARPNAPVVTPASASTPYGTPITLPLTVTGLHTSLRIGSGPASGIASIDGQSAVYAPGGAEGRQVFTVIATGPGGDSPAAEVVVTVGSAPPVEPTKPVTPAPKPTPATMEGQAGAPIRFRVAAGMTGVTGVELLTQPARGSASVEELDVLYTSPSDFVGQVSFDYRLLTEQGASEAATLTAVVHPPAAEAPVKEAVATPDTPGVVELTEGVENGPFSDAAIVSMSPASAGTAELLRGAAAPQLKAQSAAMMSAKTSGRASSARAEDAGATFHLKFKPSANFYGDVEIRYALTNRFGAPTRGVVRFLVDTREDPTRDPKVAAMVNAQAQAAARFGDAQIGNVNRRLEAVRSGSAQSMGVSLSATRGGQSDEPFVDQSRRQMLSELRAATAPNAGAATVEPAAQRSTDKVQIWTGGAVVLGESRQRGGSGGFDFATAGVSVGADLRVNNGLVVGAGAGYGRDRSDLGQGAKVESQAISAFGYASYKPNDWVFVDAVAGAARLDFDTTRTIASAILRGSRTGDELFGSVSAGLDLRGGDWAFSPYGRVQAVTATLGEYAEDGDAATALHFARHAINQTTGVVGFVGNYRLELDGGVLEPTLRGEYHWSLRRSGVANLGYATGMADMPYQVMLSAFDDHRTVGAIGLRWTTENRWIFSLDLERLFSASGDSTAIRVGGTGSF